ncbi:MAG: zf-HC2 domain-containing protein [Candidatus Acidiferrales bacterium]
MNHFDEMTCLLYLEGELAEPHAAELEAHAKECSACRAILRVLREESLLLSASLREADEALPARLAARPETSAARWAWLLGFGLAGAGAYVVWTSLIVPWQESTSQSGMGVGSLLTMLFFSGALWKGWSSMIDTIQAAALVTLGVGALALLRGRWRRRATFAALFAAMALLVAMPQPAGATEIHQGATYVLPNGQEVHDDLIVTGQSIRIDGTVDGDVIAFGQSITVNGHVTGDVIGFSQFLRVGGTVDGNIRFFANTLTLDGSVAKNVSAFAQTLEINSDGKIGGSLMSFAGELLLDGKLGGSLLAFNQRTDIDGTVGGPVQVRGKDLTIDSTAQLNGPIRFTGEDQPQVAQGARLASQVQFKKTEPHRREATGRTAVRELLRYGAAVLAGLLLMSVLPGLYVDAVGAARRFAVAMGVGAVSLITFAFLVIVSCALLFAGVGGGLAIALAYVPVMYLAQIFVGAWLGDTILGGKAGIGAQLGRLALGLLILHAVRLVPFLGFLVWVAVLIWGSGAILLALYQRSRSVSVAATAVA